VSNSLLSLASALLERREVLLLVLMLVLLLLVLALSRAA